MIYLVRHGEAAASWGEHLDPGLSDKGREQAEAVAQRLRGHRISRVLTSPMQRCRETAAPFSTTPALAAVIEPAVTEIPTPDVVVDRVPWLRGMMSGVWVDAPAIIRDWRQTLIDTISELPDETVVFTHFIAINAIVGYLEGRDAVTVFLPDHCSITQIERTSEGLKVIEHGEEASTKIL